MALLPIFSPTLVQIGVETDIPKSIIAIIQPINWIPCKSAIMAGIAVLIIVLSNPAITFAKTMANVTIVTCFFVMSTPTFLKNKKPQLFRNNQG